MAVVYRVRNKVNGHLYIGMTSKTLAQRQKRHFYEAHRAADHMPFLRAIRKYGESMFEWDILGTFQTVKEAVDAEVFWIAKLRPHYNATKGGPGITGIKRSAAWKSMMSARFKGRTFAPEGVRKMIEMTRAGAHCKSVICLNDGNVFRSLIAAAAHYGISGCRVTASASGRELSAKGLYFAYGDIPLAIEQRERLIAERQGRKSRLLRAAHAKRTPADFLRRFGVQVALKAAEPLMPIPAAIYREGEAEVWRAVVGYEMSYAVSDHGRVRSLDRHVVCWANNGTTLRRGKMMNLRPMKHGRLCVTLCRSSQYATFAVAVLVANAFVGIPLLPSSRVLRRNSDVTNDRASNLYWGTAKEVALERRRRGTSRSGQSHHHAKLSDADVRLIRRSRGQIKQVDLAIRLGVSSSTISSIQRGRSRRLEISSVRP